MEDVTFNKRKMKELEDNLLYKLSATRGSVSNSKISRNFIRLIKLLNIRTLPYRNWFVHSKCNEWTCNDRDLKYVKLGMIACHYIFIAGTRYF